MSGLKYLYMCEAGKLKNNPPANSVIVTGVNKSNLLSFKDDEMQKTIFDQTMQNRKLVRIEVEDYGSDSNRLLAAINYTRNNGCDAEVVEKNAVWDFAVGNGYQLGFDFEFTLTEKERYIKYILERSFDFTEAYNMLANVDINFPPVYDSVPSELLQYSFARWNYLSLIANYPEIFKANNIINYKLNIKTNGIKNFRKMTINPYIEVTFDVEFFMRELDFSQYNNLLVNTQNFMSLEFKNTETNDKQLRFIFNHINPERDFNIQPKGETIKMTFKRKYNPRSIGVNLGSTADTFNFQ
jgi:hypothetical protein